MLKSTPATNADKIDLITQPSARHDAAGSSGLIDIRTRKIRLRGVNLALNGNGSLGRTGGGYGGVSMNVRENKFNLYLNYSYYQGKDVIDLFIDRAFERDGGRMMQNSYRKRRNYSHYFRTGCDYYLNERTVWGEFKETIYTVILYTTASIINNNTCKYIYKIQTLILRRIHLWQIQ